MHTHQSSAVAPVHGQSCCEEVSSSWFPSGDPLRRYSWTHHWPSNEGSPTQWTHEFSCEETCLNVFRPAIWRNVSFRNATIHFASVQRRLMGTDSTNIVQNPNSGKLFDVVVEGVQVAICKQPNELNGLSENESESTFYAFTLDHRAVFRFGNQSLMTTRSRNIVWHGCKRFIYSCAIFVSNYCHAPHKFSSSIRGYFGVYRPLLTEINEDP